MGEKNTSRQVASQVEGNTGISASIIKKLLPMAATLLMGTMSKGANSSGLLGNDNGQSDLLGSVISSMLGSNSSNSNQSGAGDLVGGLLKSFLK